LLSFRYSERVFLRRAYTWPGSVATDEKGFRVVCEVNDAARKKLADLTVKLPVVSHRHATKPVTAKVPVTAKAPFNASKARQHQEVWANYLEMEIESTDSVGGKMILIPPVSS